MPPKPCASTSTPAGEVPNRGIGSTQPGKLDYPTGEYAIPKILENCHFCSAQSQRQKSLAGCRWCALLVVARPATLSAKRACDGVADASQKRRSDLVSLEEETQMSQAALRGRISSIRALARMTVSMNRLTVSERVKKAAF